MNSPGRKISVGTFVMIIMTLLVMIGSTMILVRLFSGNSADLSGIGKKSGQHITKNSSAEKTASASSGSGRSKKSNSGRSGETSAKEDEKDNATANAGGRFTMTVAGTAALEESIRKSGYLSELKIYDFSEIMLLLKNELTSDINIVFLENILTDSTKPSDVIAPSATAIMLKEAGFNMAACGFQGAWNKKADGIADTRKYLTEAGITPIGVYSPDDTNRIQVMNCGGIPTTVLQYTATISQNDRKKMNKENQSGTVPAADPETIAADISEARSRGANLVVVLMNWGSRGKQPDSNMKKLAQNIADAGADIIIGSGSRKPQAAEYLNAIRTDGSEAQVLCVWSLGLTLSKDRSKSQNMAGYLFHVEFVMDSTRDVRINNLAYTPLYTWLYTTDKRDSYRCLAANRTPPDGMDIKQQNTMSRVADITREALKDSPLTER